MKSYVPMKRLAGGPESWRYAALLAGLAAILGAGAAQAQGIRAGDVSRDIQNELPQPGSQGFGSVPQLAPETPVEDLAKSEIKPEKKKRFIQDPSRDLPEEETLAAPISRIVLATPLLYDDIAALLQERAFNKTQIGLRDLDHVRQKIWQLGIQNKKLLHVNFRIVPEPKANGKSWLIVKITEITVRHVTVVAEGYVRQAVLDDIQAEGSREFYQERVLDLGELDDKIKSRLRLGDVLLHSSVVPVDETHIDLKILVREVAGGEPSGLLQYDNAGGWSFGRDRVLSGLSLPGVAFAGDRIDFLGMKTMDIGNGDWINGTYYGRGEYQVPVGEWGIRLDTWVSGLHYHEVAATPSNTYANGEALEAGQGVIRPVYTSKNATLDMRADYYFKYTVDRVFETERSDEKNEHNGRVRAIWSQALSDTQSLQVTLGATEGFIDLTGDRDAYAQDQAGPRVDGLFTKLEEDGTWAGTLGDDNRTDFRLATRAQWARNNLDSMEQFTLGGASGLRAFGSGEASGDRGYMIDGDLGYALGWGVRPFMLYDVGGIWKSADPYLGEGGVQSYVLQDAGAGLEAALGPVMASLTYAHQVGPNPGLSANGLDIDNSKQHYRVWSSLTYRY